MFHYDNALNAHLNGEGPHGYTDYPTLAKSTAAAPRA
jgi:hypothetical protein